MTARESSARDEQSARRRRLALLARADGDELAAAAARIGAETRATDLRGPETGLIMVRGRVGGDGDRFNLGEATLSRSTVRLMSGEIGYGQRLGTDRAAARLAAVLDAAAQTETGRMIVAELCDHIASRLATEASRLAGETAATRVDFFTLVRGED